MKKISIITMCALLLCTYSCKKDPSTTNEGTSRYNIRMTDGPGDYESIVVNVKEIEIKISGKADVIIPVNKLIDIISLSNGKDTLLASRDLPSGKVSEVRLILADNNNTIKVNGQVYNLETPSAQQSGLKLKIQQELIAGIEYTLKLDFDAAKSIVTTGSGKYILKPVIRVITEAVSGAIKGITLPVNSRPAIMAIISGDTIGTTYADSTSGKFLIQGLAAGTYDIHFDAIAGFKDTIIRNQIVNTGQVKDMGTINF